MLEPLNFAELRRANFERLPHFKNNLGQPAHDVADGSDWSLGDWMTAVCGELGEAANVLKKIRRGDHTLNAAKPELADEFADVVIYLDILAARCGIDLGNAIRSKWNYTSRKIDYDGRL